MLKFIFTVILALGIGQESLATDSPLLRDYEKEGIRNRSKHGKHYIPEQERPEPTLSDKENKKSELPPKNWKKIEQDTISTMGKFRQANNEPLWIDTVIYRLKGKIGHANIFESFVRSNGIFDNDQMEYLRRRCLIALEWEKANKTTLGDLWVNDKQAYGKAIVEILNKPIVDN